MPQSALGHRLPFDVGQLVVWPSNVTGSWANIGIVLGYELSFRNTLEMSVGLPRDTRLPATKILKFSADDFQRFKAFESVNYSAGVDYGAEYPDPKLRQDGQWFTFRCANGEFLTISTVESKTNYLTINDEGARILYNQLFRLKEWMRSLKEGE